MGSLGRRMCRLVTFLLCCLAGVRGQDWANDYDGYLYYECPTNQSVTHIISIHDNGPEDRIWAFECSPSQFSLETCSWSGVIAGMESEHDNGSEDRRWNSKCCFAEPTCYHDCHFTPYINDFDEPMDYSVQDDYVIVGLEPEHNNKHDDRKWRLQVCKIQSC